MGYVSVLGGAMNCHKCGSNTWEMDKIDLDEGSVPGLNSRMFDPSYMREIDLAQQINLLCFTCGAGVEFKFMIQNIIRHDGNLETLFTCDLATARRRAKEAECKATQLENSLAYTQERLSAAQGSLDRVRSALRP